MAEKENSNMMMPALLYGAIIGGVYILNLLVQEAFNIHLTLYSRISGSVILFAGILYAMYSYRKEYCNNIITYSKAFGFGVLTTVVYGIISMGFFILFIKFINPDYAELLRAFTEERMLERGMEASEIETAMNAQQRFQTPLFQFIFGLLGTVLWGTIFSLIIAIFIKKEPKNPFEGIE